MALAEGGQLPCGKAVGAGGAVGFLKFALFGDAFGYCTDVRVIRTVGMGGADGGIGCASFACIQRFTGTHIVVVRFRAGGKAVEEGGCGTGGPFDAGGFFRCCHPAARGCSDDTVAVDVARAFRFDISPALRAVVSVFRMDFCCGDAVNVVGGAESVGQACAFAFSCA